MKESSAWWQRYSALHPRVLGWVRGKELLQRHARQPHAAPTSDMSHEDMRRYVLHHLQEVRLVAPFAWRSYFSTLQHVYAHMALPVDIQLQMAALPAGTFAHMVISAGTSPSGGTACNKDKDTANAPQRYKRIATLLVAQSDEHADGHTEMERAVYHELGHLLLGHAVVQLDDADRRIDAEQRHAETLTVQQERDAELFATILQRLAHGWDPGAVVAPRLERFFDVLS